MSLAVSRLALIAGLLAVATTTTACARRGLVQKEMSDSEARMLLVGRATPRIVDLDASGFPTKDKTLAVSQEAEPLVTYAVRTDSVINGFGIGGLRETPEEFGPVLVLGKDVLARTPAGWTDRATTTFYATLYGGPVRGTLPTADYKIQGGGKGLTLNDVYRRALIAHEGPLFIIGEGNFANLALADGEPTPTPAIAAKPRAVFTALVVRDEVQLAMGPDRAFKFDPAAEVALDETSVTHVGVLDRATKVDVHNLDGVAASVQNVVVPDPANTRIKNGRILVYQVEGFREP